MITVTMPVLHIGPSELRRPFAMHIAPMRPGEHFIGVTASGRRVPCTVAADGTFSADSHEVVRLIGWLPC